MTEKYTPIPLRKIDGDVDVGRNVAIGGDAIVQGKSHYKGDVRIDGWLDAENIKGPNKGLFTTLESLKRAYPHPKDGWWAIVSKTLPGPIYVGDKGQWIRAGGETSTDVRLVSVDKTRRADEAEHAKTADVANYANEAGKLSDDSDLINKFASKEHDDTFKGIITFLKGIIARAVSYFEGIVNRGDISNNGDITNTGNINNTGNITTNNLTVTDKATFFELEILKAKAAGGIIIQSAATFKVDDFEDTAEGYVCYQLAEKDGKVLLQMCRKGDQMLCHGGLNVGVGVSHNVSNHYYWRMVTDAPEAPVERGGKKYLKIVLSKTDFAKGSDKPQVGDEQAQVGNRVDADRQCVIINSAYQSLDNGLVAPYWAKYVGVYNFDLKTHRETYFAMNDNQIVGNLRARSSSGEIRPVPVLLGEWKSGQEYGYYDSVTHDGRQWLCIVEKGKRTTEEPGKGDAWMLLVDKGEKGDRGRTSYLHIKYSNDGGNTFTSNNGEDTGDYMGQYVDYTQADSDNPRDYKWTLVKGKDGKDGKDAVEFRLVSNGGSVIVKGNEKESAIVRINVAYQVFRCANGKEKSINIEDYGLKLKTSISGLTFSTQIGEDDYTYRIDKDVSYKDANIQAFGPYLRVLLTRDSWFEGVIDSSVIPIQYDINVAFEFGKKVDGIDGKIDGIAGTVKTLDGRVSGFEATIDHFSTVVKDKVSSSELKQTAKDIVAKVGSSVNANLLWGSDLDLSQVQDVMENAYKQSDIIKNETEKKAEWKRSRDNADSDDDRIRYQKGMDDCDREIAQAQGEVAKCKEAIRKRLGIVISGDMEFGNREMFQYLKGEGVDGSDAIHFKNVYKREGWAKWTNFGWKDVPLKPNTKYTISVWVKFKSYGRKGRMYVDSASDDGRYCFGGYLYKEHYYDRADIDEWQRVRYVFNSGASKRLSALFFSCIADEEEDAQCEIWFCRPKLEEGEVATPWCAYDGTVDALLAGGFDIKEKKFTITSDNFVVQNNRGEQTFLIDKNGKINNGMLSLDGLDAKRAVIKNLRFQSNSVAPYFVTEESMEEFAAYCTRRYAGWNNQLLFPFDIATFFVFLVKPRWYVYLNQGNRRDFSLRNRDIAVSESMAHSFVVDYYYFAFELFWHNMVGKTVTIANSTNEKIQFGVKLKTKILSRDGKRIMQIGGRLDNLPDFPINCVEFVDLLPGQMASFKYTLLSGAPTQPEAETEGYFLLQDLFDFAYYKKLFEVGYYTEQGFNLFDKKYLDLFNTDEERVKPKGGFPKTK